VLSEPQTRYVKSGDAHIAYQVVGDAPVDLIVVRGYISHVEVAWESPALAAFSSGPRAGERDQRRSAEDGTFSAACNYYA
jgi:hypothetical protein